MKHIVCFHLFNDYSGSPKVLRVVLEGLLKRGYTIDLVTSRGGVLDELRSYPNLRMHGYNYHFSNRAAVTMLRYCAVQLYTFVLAFRWLLSRNTTFYINTLLPAGPALAGRLMGKRVVYHYHENAFVKGAFYSTLAAVMQRLAHRIVCVSGYQASFLKRQDKVTVVPNALTADFVSRLKPDPEAAFGRKTVLMLGSLKEYKGTKEFIELAHRLPQYKFELVVNDTEENLARFIAEQHVAVPENLTVYPRQEDVAPFYNRASVVLNLSNKRDFVETFGLTALEAMTTALPVIVPTVGGIAEMVTDGVEGYKIDVSDLDSIERRIAEILGDYGLYATLAQNARHSAGEFSEEAMVSGVEAALRN